MTDWPVKTLGEVCEVARGTSITRKETKEGLIPVVAGGIDVAYFHSVQNRPAGTITVSSSGANAGFVNRWEIPIFASDCSTVVAKEGGMVFGDYAFRFLQFKQFFINTELRRGAAQPHVYAKDIAAIEIPVPPLGEQKRIVAILDAASARVTELTACYEQARTHSNNLFTSALREALKGNPDWPVKTLGDILTFSYGKPLEPKDRDDNGAIPVYGANGVKARSKRSLVSGPSIIVGRKGSAGELNFCDGPFWPLDVTYFVEHDVKVTDLTFLHYLLSFMDLPSLAKGVKPGINRNDVYVLQSPVPPLEEQKRIVARLDAMRAKTSEMIAAYDAKLKAAKNLRQSVLEAAFAGQL
jgi:restriction endonuclease S subunit